MGILVILIPLALLLSAGGVAAYWWAWRHRQFDDLDTPAHKILFDDAIGERILKDER
jgi:cbb3-type cytochrome oxidase maturation protein